jgi:5-methylcytosine-specific restriction enzyme A
VAERDDRFRRMPSTAGFCEPSKLPKGPNGRALCRECGTEVAPPRRTFCSKTCVDVWTERHNVAVQRRKVFERDGGKCRACGLDVRALEERIRNLTRRIRSRHDWPRWTELRRLISYKREQRVAAAVRRMGLTVGRHFWEMDHIRPVVMGGGSCGTENLRVLCVPCHRLVTAELARRRAARRRVESERTEKGD